MNSLNNGMVVVPILTPYGTQLVPMSVNQLLGSGMGNQMPSADLNSLTQTFQQQQAANLRNIQAIQSQLRSFQSNQNPIVSSILQQAQAAQLNATAQKAQFGHDSHKMEMDKITAKLDATKLQKSSSSKKDLGAIGDLRPMYRSTSRGQSSGFSSGNTSESDSGHSRNSISPIGTKLHMKGKTQSYTSTSQFSSNSSGWSEGCSGDETGSGKFNSFKLLEQRSGSKALFLQKMVEVLESYFSDEGLKRNQFLAKQIQLNPEGIPLKKVAAMRRVKALTRDYMTVASAIRKSSMLELSRDGQLVKRTVQPASLEPPKPIRTVLAINLHENPTVETVTSAFAKYGDLTQVRVIRPTSALPAYLKEFTMWVPDLGTTNCAVIEFETQDEAQAACREINMANRENGKLRVALLKPGARIRRTLYRQYKEDDGKTTETKKLPKFELKTLSDSGHGSDGSAEISTENSEDEEKCSAKVVGTRRAWLSKSLQKDAETVLPENNLSNAIRQPRGPVEGSRGFDAKFSRNRSRNFFA
ncbi:Oidioi.mRNA.OKI2018_I69.chr1.g3910.t2.cds [Oikopleura dioica]|uniref:Oidioi.mRNA.OKI2018_I69.chr1.g3910.t2.cds n=1 Tax=Oikopleura dioica TaxID=34765 RepID=A0ABN7SVM1_OIKDI|nr:Oidioi.mRNA.OKI2018_I69.chr1.g3910.t2.cds [Oikopleura dioica]